MRARLGAPWKKVRDQMSAEMAALVRDPVFVLDRAGDSFELAYADDELAAGGDARHLIGARLSEFLDPRDLGPFVQWAELVLAGRETRKDVIQFPRPFNDHEYEVSARRTSGPGGRRSRILVLCRDVSDQRAAEASQDQANRRFGKLVDHVPGLIWLLDRNGKVTGVSSGVQRLLGLDVDEVVGLAFADLVTAGDRERTRELISRSVHQPDDQLLLADTELIGRDGRRVWVESIVTNLLKDPDINALCVNSHDVSDRRRAEEILARRASYHPLTDLPNRMHLAAHLDKLAEGGTWPNVGLVTLNLDEFTIVNDSLGHTTADRVLQLVAARLEGHRSTDYVAHLAGDEFAAVFEGVRDPDRLVGRAEGIAAHLAEPITLDGREIFVTVSAGVAIAGESVGPDRLVQNADTALQEAKAMGRNQVVFFSNELEAKARSRVEIMSALPKAIRDDELEVHYQPIVTFDGALHAVEALLRWRRGDTWVNTGSLIELAEHSGQIVPLGEWVLNRALRDRAELLARAPDCRSVRMSINVSARQLLEAGFDRLVERALVETGTNPALITIEVTESMTMHDPAAAIRALLRLRELGLSVAIDDFGTGQSSLAYLERLPASTLKIDRAFLVDLDGAERIAKVLPSIITLAHRLDMAVVAEGVETPEQRDFLADNYCDYAQGWLFAKAMPLPDLVEAVTTGRLPIEGADAPAPEHGVDVTDDADAAIALDEFSFQGP